MRLIDADALKEVISNNPLIDFTDDDLFEIIDNAPTAEEDIIQEVLNKRCMTAVANEYLIALHGTRPQGEWIRDKASKFTVVCSGCDYESIIWNARYCPNCGARMKEKHYEK